MELRLCCLWCCCSARWRDSASCSDMALPMGPPGCWGTLMAPPPAGIPCRWGGNWMRMCCGWPPAYKNLHPMTSETAERTANIPGAGLGSVMVTCCPAAMRASGIRTWRRKRCGRSPPALAIVAAHTHTHRAWQLQTQTAITTRSFGKAGAKLATSYFTLSPLHSQLLNNLDSSGALVRLNHR